MDKAEVLATYRMPTEEMADAVRGILQVIRGKRGATFDDVRRHCDLRGDDMDLWPAWALDAEGHVTEQGAAFLIFEVMQARSRSPASTRTHGT